MTDPTGEDGWLALVDEASGSASDLEQRVAVVELYKRAIAAEPWSIKLWLANCEWIWSLHTDCQNGDAGWPEEEQILGQELFSLELALEMWQDGAQATQFRLNDSHELWNRWISIELHELQKATDKARIERIRGLFLNRLQIPHSTWDDTSQNFSTFVTKYDEPSWEATMVQTTQLAKNAKDLYSLREGTELNLKKAVEAGDTEAQYNIMAEYLSWETAQAQKKPRKGVLISPLILCVALHERALSGSVMAFEPSVWEEYIIFLSSTSAQNQSQLPSVLSVCRRATAHCPWSGVLWSRYILAAELVNMPFADVEQIKHTATSTGLLDRDGMAAVVEMYIAWCGYLRRRTTIEGATEEDIDIADVGLAAALESVQDWGQKLYGKDEYKGDPLFRLERIMIQYLTNKGAIEDGRNVWRKLAKIRGDSYEFWQQYYLWELTVRKPNTKPVLATAVLTQAVHRKTLDWPERMLEVYVRHCNNYEDAHNLSTSLDTFHKQAKIIAVRRQKEAADAEAYYAEQSANVVPAEEMTGVEESSSGAAKRKHEPVTEGESNSNKKLKTEEQEFAKTKEQNLKRDRENTSILVTNLPPGTTQTKVRQYFKEYGSINSLTVKTEADELSATALVEFRSNEDVQSAMLRDRRYFSDHQIQVQPGTGLTLYVTNYPPSADDAYLQRLFKECGEIFSIRWPSLKYNTHRRFCYVTFRTAEASAAATQLDGTLLEGHFKLLAKYSDPLNKKNREGPIAEGREVHVTSLDRNLNEDEVKDVFSKYGHVENVKILKTASGESKGAAFVTFEKKEEADAALELDRTKLKSSILAVEISSDRNFKRTAVSGAQGTAASPAPDGDSAMSPSPAPSSQSQGFKEGASTHTMTVMNIPDTINDTRIRALVEPYGEIVRMVLRPDHQGAIVEFSEAGAAGRASLGLRNYEIAPGRLLRTGDIKDLLKQKEEVRTDRIQIGQGKKAAATKAPAEFIKPAMPVRRPGAGPRGGLGPKRGLGYTAKASAPTASASINKDAPETSTNSDQAGEAESKSTKSNADFKAMFLAGSK